MRIYIHFGLIIDIRDDQSSFICIAFSFAHSKLDEAHKQKKMWTKKVYRTDRNLQACAHKQAISTGEKMSARKRCSKCERERKWGFKRAFAHTVPTNGNRRNTINLLCYVENPYNASYWPYFTLSCGCYVFFCFIRHECECEPLSLSFALRILSLFDHPGQNKCCRTIEWVNKWALVYGRHIDSRTSHSHICIHTAEHSTAQNIKWNAPARRRTQNSH